MADRQPALVTPFWVRIATETSLSPGWLLIAFPAVLYPTYLLLEVLFGRGLAAATDFGGDFEAWNAPVYLTLLGYVVMMCTYVARGTLRDLEALRPVLEGDETGYADLRQQLIQFKRHRLWIGALVGFILTCVFQELVAGRLTRFVTGEWSLRDPCVFVILAAFVIVIGRGAVYLIDSALLYSRIGERHVAVDLLDLGPVSPLTRHGLRITLFIVIYVASQVIPLAATVPLVPNPRIVPFFLSFVYVWPIALAAIAFVLPVRGLRRQIRARKAEKLAQLRDEIRRNEELMAGSGTEAAEAGAKLPGLLAFEKRVESVREWPFDAPTLTRFFLYVAIPLGSWVGGALVERLLGAALD